MGVNREFICSKCSNLVEILVPIEVANEDIPELEFCPHCGGEGSLVRKWSAVPHIGEKGKGYW